MTQKVKPYPKNKLKVLGEVSWITFAMSIALILILFEKASLKTKSLFSN